MLKTLLGDNYRDDMTIDEINEALKGLNLVPNGIEKDKYDKAVSELNKKAKDWETKYLELEEKHLTEDEKIKKAIADAEAKGKQYLTELSKLRAKEVFVGAGLSEEDYSSVMDFVVTDDADSTKARAESIVSLLTSKVEAAKKAEREANLKSTPKPPAGGGTKINPYQEQIDKALESGDITTAAALMTQAQLEK